MNKHIVRNQTAVTFLRQGLKIFDITDSESRGQLPSSPPSIYATGGKSLTTCIHVSVHLYVLIYLHKLLYTSSSSTIPYPVSPILKISFLLLGLYFAYYLK